MRSRVLRVMVSILIFGACTLAAWAGPADELPRRLVLALDGIPYPDVFRLQQVQKRCLVDYRPVVRNISTYPSLSDVAWADIFRTGPPVGYQRYHFSLQRNRIVGGTVTELVQRLEYEERMHYNPDTPTKHLLTYLFADHIARDELDHMLEAFWRAKGTSTFYTFTLATDSLLHTDGDIDGFLCHLDARLKELRAKYRAMTGRELEVVMLSDHGNNHASGGLLIDARENLQRSGYRVASRLREPRDVVFTSSGILSSTAVFVQPEELVQVAGVFLATEGVDLVTYVDPEEPASILVRKRGRSARIRKAPDGDAYAYVPIYGDPLNYAPEIDALRRAGKVDPDGFVSADDWLLETADHSYPAAPERIHRGHFVVTLNTAPLLVSLEDGYEITYGVVKALSHVKRRGGTHGNLGTRCSSGVLLSNFLETGDVTTNRVGDLLGFDDMFDFKEREKGVAFEDSRIIGYDLQRKAFVDEGPALGPENRVFVNLWDPRFARWGAGKAGMQFRFVVRKREFAQPDPVMSDRVFAAESLPHTPDFTEFRLPMSVLIEDYLAPGSYRLKVYARWLEPARGWQEEAVLSARFYTNIHGQIVAY